MDGSAEPAPVRSRGCPRCGRPSVRRFRPFCSSTCRDRDLLDWLDERHAVPVVEDEGVPEAPETASGGPDGEAAGRP
jgi:endogenous inhibitor of DNA gyrase (YacG/DUF329 family)